MVEISRALVVDQILNWVKDPSKGLGITLQDMRHLSEGCARWYMFTKEERAAREYLLKNAWELEINHINRRLKNGTYTRGGCGEREKEVLPLTEAKRLRMTAKRDRLLELLVK